MRVTHSPTRAFTSSGPRRSPSAVDPTTSANRAVIGRISSPSLPWGRGTAVPGPGATASSAGTGVPHAGQNRAPAGIRAPHATHVSSPISTTPSPVRTGIVPGSEGRGGAVALLVLAPGAAGAGGVAPDLVAHGLGSGAGVGVVAMDRPDALGAGAGRFVLADQLHVVDVPDELVADPGLHLVEHREGLAAVLGERVALAVRPEVDALLQVVHLVQVLAPLRVDHREQDHPLELPHDLRRDLLLLLLVRAERLLQDPLLEFAGIGDLAQLDRKSTRLNSSHV